MTNREIKDPIARCSHAEAHGLEPICADLRKLRLVSMQILQNHDVTKAIEMRDGLTDILTKIDRLVMERMVFIQERQRVCKGCEKA